MCRKCDSYQGHHQIMKLLNLLIKDEKKINRKLYSSGPYWSYKNLKTIYQIKKRGISDFRGISSGVGTSFTDNLPSDIRNELGFKGRLLGNIFEIPILNKIFKEQVVLTEGYIKKYLQAFSAICANNENVKKLIDKYEFKNTTEYGCVNKFTFKKKEYSTFYLEIADRIEKLSKNFDFKRVKTFFEIGGGFGANIHFLLTNFPNIKKIIYLDTVPNLYLGTKYLKRHFGENVKEYSDIRGSSIIEFKNDDELEIICIPPWEIEKLKVKIDHFHNAASFVEMPRVVVENYYKFIKKFDTREISLISYGGYDENTTFKPETLNEIFENKLKISWNDWFIDKYGNSNIYLCSK